MREIVERLAYPTRRVDGVAHFLGEHERRHAGDVCLPCENLQVDHQLDMRLEVVRNTGWRRGNIERRRALLPGERYATLDLPHVSEVAVEPHTVHRRQRFLQLLDVFQYRVDETPCLRAALDTLLLGRTIAEEPLEHHLRVVLHRERRGWRLPGDGVAICAREAGAAA